MKKYAFRHMVIAFCSGFAMYALFVAPHLVARCG